MAATSKPPTLVSTSTTSAGSGFQRAMAESMISFLRAKPASFTPPPRPVVSSAGRFSRQDRIALEVVVLPMPISPMPRISTPSAAACAAIS